MVTIRKPQEQHLVRPAQKLEQGGRTAYSMVMSLGMLDSCISAEVSPKHIVKANRRFNQSHADKIADYLYDRTEYHDKDKSESESDWVLGAILLGIAPRYVSFEPYQASDGEPSLSLGEIHIPWDGGVGSILILDGQHRRMAIKSVRDRLLREINEVEENLGSNGGNSRGLQRLHKLETKLEALSNMAIPVALYVETSVTKLGQMFAELARTRPIDEITKTRFDLRDPFNRAAHALEKGSSELLAGRLEMERSTPLRSSNELLSLNQLARCLKYLKYGYGGRVSHDRLVETDHNFDDLLDLGIAWTDDFLRSAREEYEVLHSDVLEDDFIANQRGQKIAYSATVLQLLAGCVYEWNQLKRSQSELAEYLRNCDFDLKSDNCLFRKTDMLIPGDTSLISRSQNMKATIKYIVEQAQLANS